MNVALYARVSSDRQDVDLSISSQLRALREHAEKHGYRVVREYVEEAESGRTADRPQFQRMIGEARRATAPFQAVLVWKYSRFARNREDAIVFKSLLKKHGVRVVSITEPSEDTPTGHLLEAIIESIDEFYSANLAQEVLRGMREAASRGFYLPSRAPYGYRRKKVLDGGKERTTLEPDPATAPVVARMFRSVEQGAGLKEVCRGLSDQGIPSPRGKSWTKTTAWGILTNEAYTGTLVWGKTSKGGHKLEPIRVEAAWQPIVDQPVFSRVQSLLRERAPAMMNPRRVSSSYLLSGLVKCGTCGRSLTGQKAKSGKFAYYVCGTLLKQGKGTCDAPYLNARRLEGLVVDKIKENVLTEEKLTELVMLVNEELDAAAHEDKDRTKVLESELVDIQRRLDRLYDALETGKVTLDDLSPRIHHLRHRQEQVQAAKADAEETVSERSSDRLSNREVRKYVGELRRLIQESELAERKAFIKSFVREIVVKGDQAELRYVIPLGAGGASTPIHSDTVAAVDGVLASVRVGGAAGTRTPYPFNAIEVLSQMSYSPTDPTETPTYRRCPSTSSG